VDPVSDTGTGGKPLQMQSLATCIICKVADSMLNVYLRTIKLLLADAEHELPPKTWRALRDVLLLALRGRRA
jgi:hypothetical protein